MMTESSSTNEIDDDNQKLVTVVTTKPSPSSVLKVKIISRQRRSLSRQSSDVQDVCDRSNNNNTNNNNNPAVVVDGVERRDNRDDVTLNAAADLAVDSHHHFEQQANVVGEVEEAEEPFAIEMVVYKESSNLLKTIHQLGKGVTTAAMIQTRRRLRQPMQRVLFQRQKQQQAQLLPPLSPQSKKNGGIIRRRKHSQEEKQQQQKNELLFEDKEQEKEGGGGEEEEDEDTLEDWREVAAAIREAYPHVLGRAKAAAENLDDDEQNEDDNFHAYHNEDDEATTTDDTTIAFLIVKDDDDNHHNDNYQEHENNINSKQSSPLSLLPVHLVYNDEEDKRKHHRRSGEDCRNKHGNNNDDMNSLLMKCQGNENTMNKKSTENEYRSNWCLPVLQPLPHDRRNDHEEFDEAVTKNIPESRQPPSTRKKTTQVEGPEPPPNHPTTLLDNIHRERSEQSAYFSYHSIDYACAPNYGTMATLGDDTKDKVPVFLVKTELPSDRNASQQREPEDQIDNSDTHEDDNNNKKNKTKKKNLKQKRGIFGKNEKPNNSAFSVSTMSNTLEKGSSTATPTAQHSLRSARNKLSYSAASSSSSSSRTSATSYPYSNAAENPFGHYGGRSGGHGFIFYDDGDSSQYSDAFKTMNGDSTRNTESDDEEEETEVSAEESSRYDSTTAADYMEDYSDNRHHQRHRRRGHHNKQKSRRERQAKLEKIRRLHEIPVPPSSSPRHDHHRLL